MLRAEILKLRTLPSTRIAFLAGAVGLLVTQVLFVGLIPALADGTVIAGDIPVEEFGAADPGTAEFQLTALNLLGGGQGAGTLGIATIAILLLGMLVATTDYRFGGIVGTALAQPRRGQIVVGKTGATIAAGAVLGAILAVVVSVVLAGALALRGIGLELAPLEALGILGRGVIVVVLLALLGLGIGTLVRNQVASILVVFAVLLGEPILQGIVSLVVGTVPTWATYLPSSLASAGIGGSWGAILGLAAIAAALLGAATLVLRRRDL